MLVICETNKKISSIQKYSQLGYSVSAYSPKQLALMKKHGSLFLQHLKIESTVLYDQGDLFSTFISGCELQSPSHQEIHRSANSIINAMQCPEVARLSWWQADYMFVLSRDYFVKYFATKGRLIFNFKKLCIEISKEFSLLQHEIEFFVKLREFKSVYRSSGPKGCSVANSVNGWIQVLSKVLGRSVAYRYNKYDYLNCRHYTLFESTYELLRYIESLRILLPHIGCESKIEQYIEKMIASPNHYSSTSVKGKIFLIDYLFEFRKTANKSKHVDLGKLSPFFFQKTSISPKLMFEVLYSTQ